MNTERIDEKAVFNTARKIADTGARSSYVELACAENPEALHRVLDLLRVHEEQQSFLESPPPGLDATQGISPITEQPGDTIGPYKLLQQIGEGGMGVVYMAEQKEPVKRRVALKIIKPGMDTRQVIARFEAERQALAMMDHPNIAKVLDAGQTDSGRPYFVMELVNGLPVTKYCDEQHLNPKERLELFVPICQAVQHAHQKGIIHRDLKPSNILVALYDGRPVPKIIDFGVAKATSQTLTEKTMFTQLGQVVGTLEYMSPEQAEQNQLDIDTRSDIYSLGVVLYELLTGETPFDRARLRSAAFDEMLRIIREEEPSKPSTKVSDSESLPSIAANRRIEPARLGSTIRGELDWIVLKALEKDRARRYETASKFAEDVQHYLNDEAVVACPPSIAYQLKKFTRRNGRRLVVATILCVALLVAVGSLGWAVRDQAAREQIATREQSARQERFAQQIDSILSDVNRLAGDGKWREALKTAEQAAALVKSGEADLPARHRVQHWLADLQLVRRCEEARFITIDAASSEEMRTAEADQAYRRAFAAAGIEFENLTVDQSARKLRSRSHINVRLANELTNWARIRHKIDGEASEASWKHLSNIADMIDPDPWRRRLRSLLNTKDGRRSALLKLAVSADVKSVPTPGIIHLARLLADEELFDEAVSLLLSIQQQHPEDLWVNLWLGYCYGETTQAKFGESLAYSRAALALRPESAKCWSNVGACLAKLRRYEEAEPNARKAAKLAPGVARYHNNLAACLFHQGKTEESILELQKAIELNAKSYAEPHRNLGRALRELGKFDEAIAAYRKAIEIRPKYIDAHYDLGVLLEKRGDLAASVIKYRETIKLRSNHVQARYNLGNLLQGEGRITEAIAEYREAIKRNPNFFPAHVNLGNALRKNGELMEAIDEYRLAIQLKPDNTTVRTNLGTALIETGRLVEASYQFMTLIDLDPKYANAHYWLGVVLLKQGNLDEAIPAFQKTIELYPKARSYRVVGDAFLQHDQLPRAIAMYCKVLTMEPSDDRTFTSLAEALAKKGTKEIELSFTKAAEIDEDPTLADVRSRLLIETQRRITMLLDSETSRRENSMPP